MGKGLADQCGLYHFMDLSISYRVRDTVSTVQKAEAKRRQEEVSAIVITGHLTDMADNFFILLIIALPFL